MKKKLAGAALLVSLTVAIFGAAIILGREARAVDIVTLFASGFAAGASLVAYLRRVRTQGDDDVAEVSSQD
ncbi:MAG: hypothetical protein R3C71_14855 [Candidatus Krumholzibacteriia bacterium]|nr:hypothetical protein [bacterium]MCB9513500.1 hypothetical protein [Candidatus Latescibacterota bacterium]MCB9516213.1 hypothetical protein [Candidatus Latescibacterota bacterium]